MAEESFDLTPYATGNAVPGGASPVDYLRPAFASRIGAALAAMPPEVRSQFAITSGFRSPEREAQVYAEQHPGQPVPTYSPHSEGVAADLAPVPAVLDWIRANPQFGIGFPLPLRGEENHLEPLEGGTRIPQGLWATWNGGGTQASPTPTLVAGGANLLASASILSSPASPPTPVLASEGGDSEVIRDSMVKALGGQQAGASSLWSKLAMLSALRKMTSEGKVQRVDYDPWRSLPQASPQYVTRLGMRSQYGA